MPAKKLTLGNLAKGFWLFRTASDFFFNMDPSVIRALKLKQMVEEGLVLYRSMFRDMEMQTYDRKHRVLLWSYTESACLSGHLVHRFCLCHLWDSKTSSSFSSAYSTWRWWGWRLFGAHVHLINSKSSSCHAAKKLSWCVYVCLCIFLWRPGNCTASPVTRPLCVASSSSKYP